MVCFAKRDGCLSAAWQRSVSAFSGVCMLDGSQLWGHVAVYVEMAYAFMKCAGSGKCLAVCSSGAQTKPKSVVRVATTISEHFPLFLSNQLGRLNSHKYSVGIPTVL
jgi:ferredoxin